MGSHPLTKDSTVGESQWRITHCTAGEGSVHAQQRRQLKALMEDASSPGRERIGMISYGKLILCHALGTLFW